MGKTQIDLLADYIMAEIPGEPSASEGAGDTAIRLLKQLKADLAEAMELLKESYAGRPPNGRVFLQAITEHHERIGAFLAKHQVGEDKARGSDDLHLQ